MLLVLDVPAAGDVPVIGGQQGFKGGDVAGHDRFGIQGYCVGLGVGLTGGKAKEQGADKKCGFQKIHGILRRYAGPASAAQGCFAPGNGPACMYRKVCQCTRFPLFSCSDC